MEGKRRAVVVVATVGSATVIAGKTTLTSLITGVIPREIMLSNLGATMETLLIMANLT